MSWFALIVVLLALLILFVQMWARIKAGGMRGRPAPRLGKDWEKLSDEQKPVLIYFFSLNCRACRDMTPMVLGLQRERNDVFVVNAGVEARIARAFGVMATPATVCVRGGQITAFILGPRSRHDLLRILQTD